MRKIKSVYAFAAYHPRPGSGLNPYWVRAEAKAVRDGLDWNRLRKEGWRVVKVKLIAVGKPR